MSIYYVFTCLLTTTFLLLLVVVNGEKQGSTNYLRNNKKQQVALKAKCTPIYDIDLTGGQCDTIKKVTKHGHKGCEKPFKNNIFALGDGNFGSNKGTSIKAPTTENAKGSFLVLARKELILTQTKTAGDEPWDTKITHEFKDGFTLSMSMKATMGQNFAPSHVWTSMKPANEKGLVHASHANMLFRIDSMQYSQGKRELQFRTTMGTKQYIAGINLDYGHQNDVFKNKWIAVTIKVALDGVTFLLDGKPAKGLDYVEKKTVTNGKVQWECKSPGCEKGGVTLDGPFVVNSEQNFQAGNGAPTTGECSSIEYKDIVMTSCANGGEEDKKEEKAPKLDGQDDTKKDDNTTTTTTTEVAEKGRWFKCDNRQQKQGDKWKKCRIMKKNKVQEFSFQEYLLSKGCPKFEKKAIKEALICWGDQTPCKEYDMEELVNAFEGCNKIKTARDNLKKAGSDGQNELDKPVAKPTKPVTIFNEKFKGRLRENLEKRGYSSSAARVDMTYRTKWEFRLSTDYGVRVSNMLGNNEDRKDGTAMVFIGNKMGKSSDSSGSRYITTKPLDITKGGLISFYLKDGPDDGDKGCMATTEVFRKKEAKRLARRQNETNGKDKCLNKPPCNGHGEGVYSSNCYKNGTWVQGARLAKDEYTCHDPEAISCTCKCNIGYKAPDCKSSSLPNTRDGYSRCRSVGDPHPNTANGVNFNIYDAGEFVWSRHPDVMVEAHLMTVPRGSVAVNNGMSIRKCAGTGGNKDGKMEGPCDTVSMVRCNFKLESGGKCMSKDRSFTSPLGIKVTAHTISVDGWSIQYSCGSYMDSYLTINSPRDGKSKGLCGYYGKQGAGGDRKNGNFLASSGSRGAHHMTSRAFFNSPLTIKTGADSHFKCHSFPSPNFNGRFHFKRIMSRITSAKSMAKMDKADAGMGMKMREQATTKMLKSYRMWSLANMKDPKGNEVSIEEATKKCEAKIKHCSGLPVADKSAMVACVQDYIKVGREDGHMVLNAACDVVKEDEDNAMEDVEADERDEKLELAGEAALRVPSKTDLIVQWCVESCTSPETQKCKDARNDIMDNPLSEKTMEEVNKLCIWKQLKAFPAKLYAESNLTKDWRHMTMRVPQEAIDRTLNPINPANKGRVNMRLRFFQQAHSCFCCDVFGIDDVKVIAGGWPVRILADSKFTLYADGKEIGSGEYNEMKEIYRYRVDPSSKIFAVKVDSKGKNKGGFIASIGDSIVSSSAWKCKATLDGEDVKALVEPKTDDSNWEKAVEIGTNEGEGAIPWGTVPGIASKAFWIYTHDGYMNKPSSATCRIDTNDAWHSYSKTHLGASRWSCKSLRDRQSPFSVSLDSKSIKIAEPKQWSDDSTLETKVQPIGNSVTSYAEDNRNSVILMKVAIEDLVDKTTEGAMVKTAMLRLFVTDPSAKGFKYCMNTKPWKANEITYKSFAENMEGNVTDCKSIKAKNKDEFVALDISDYFRKWVTDEKTNFGISIMHQGDFKDAVGFSTGNVKGEDAVQKPRLNLACHGDHIRGDMVFKERKVTLLKENKRGEESRK